MKTVCISLVTFNNHEQTLSCLASLDNLDLDDIRLLVVVVDNASRKRFTTEKKHYAHFRLHIIHVVKNTGFSGGHNQAIKWAFEQKAEYVMVLNNDTTVDEKLLVSLLAGLQNHTDAGVVVPKIYFAKGHEFHKERYQNSELGKVIWYAGGEIDWQNVYGKHRGVDEVDQGQYDTVEKTCLLTGCCALFRTDVLHKTGLFDEKYFLYFEDADLSMRLLQLGYAIYYIPQAIIWHLNAGSTGGSGSHLQDYFLSRNRLLFGFTYASRKTQFALLRESVWLLLSGRMWQKKGIRDFFLRKFAKGSYPL